MTKIIVGRIGEPYGIKGWSHLFSFTDPADHIFHYPHWQIRAYQKQNAQWKSIEVACYKTHGNAFVVKFKDCDNRDQALLLKNHTISVERIELPTLKKNEYYWDDLMGLQVVNTHGFVFGVIDHLFEAGSHDVIAIVGEKTHYIPYLKSIIKEINLDKKIMIVDWNPLT